MYIQGRFNVVSYGSSDGTDKNTNRIEKNTDSRTVKSKFCCTLFSPFAHKTNDYGHNNQLKFQRRSCELKVY